MSASSWLLYGANGYTGELIAREAVARGMCPTLAGRRRQPIEALAKELNCPSAVFALDDHTALVDALQDKHAVLNCAGPFSQTARVIMQGCLATHVHYLDITGEVDVFELARSVHDKAVRAGIVLCPGVGFDVVPTDSLAAYLKHALPDATHLSLAFDSRTGFSKGTAKTAIESAGVGLRVRRAGKLVELPLGALRRTIDFGEGARNTAAISWGDVSTAYFTTGIENIEVYTTTSPPALKRMRRANLVRPLLQKRWLVRLIQKRIERGLTNPSRTERDNNPTLLWAEARNARGETRTARLKTANGYALTVNSSLGILSRLLDQATEPGYFTPTQLVGAEFVTTLPGSSTIRVE
jgi:short subunit dehydrogenase-like uncharacterized protein